MGIQTTCFGGQNPIAKVQMPDGVGGVPPGAGPEPPGRGGAPGTGGVGEGGVGEPLEEELELEAASGLPGTGSPLVASPPGLNGGLFGGITNRPLSTLDEVYLRMAQQRPPWLCVSPS